MIAVALVVQPSYRPTGHLIVELGLSLAIVLSWNVV